MTPDSVATDRHGMISGTTRVAGVIGSPLRHSLSPAIVNAAFEALGLDWSYVAFEVAPGDVARALDAMRVLRLGGLSVTMPHKEAVAQLVDRCSPDATALDAVNCIVPDGDDLVGENTDGAGFVDAVRADLGFEFAGCRAVMLGAGGAARAVVLALAREGVADIAIVNRTPANAQRALALAGERGRVVDPAVGPAAGLADAIADATLVVNATPVGMLDDRLPLDAALLGPSHTVVDLVYHPSVTPLLGAAAERGSVVANGLGMLVWQAAHAVRLWTGCDGPVAVMTEAAASVLAQRG
jgi:shikimate dehydrogenase